MEDNNYRQETNKWLKSINIQGSVIDIGGGKRTAKERLGSCEGEYKVLDRKLYKGIEFKPDIEHDLNYPLITNEQFDYAFMLFMFEFLWNPVCAFQNINKLVKQGGKIYFNTCYKSSSFPIFNEGEDYFRVTENGIKKILKETGFNLDKMSYYNGEYNFYLVEATKL